MEVGAGEGLVGGSRKASLPAPVAADQMCRVPAASQDAMRAAVAAGEEEGVAAPRPGSQQSAVMGLLCPVYCTPAPSSPCMYHHCYYHHHYCYYYDCYWFFYNFNAYFHY